MLFLNQMTRDGQKKLTDVKRNVWDTTLSIFIYDSESEYILIWDETEWKQLWKYAMLANFWPFWGPMIFKILVEVAKFQAGSKYKN